MEKSELKLYSIHAAARVLCIGRDTLCRLISEGKVGYIEIGKRKKIPHQELVRFQTESLIKKVEIKESSALSPMDIEMFFNRKKRPAPPSLDARKMLDEIIKKYKKKS
jgi:excisionase family DNA binding protein